MFRKFNKIALIITMGVVMWLLPFFVVSAETNPCIILDNITASDESGISSIVSSCNNKFKKDYGSGILSYSVNYTVNTGTTVQVSFYLSDYNRLNSDDKYDVMETILTEISNNKSLSTSNRNRFYSFIADCDGMVSKTVRQLNSDITADFNWSYNAIRPFTGKIGSFLGLIATTMFIIMGLSLAVDMFYISNPMVQNFFNSEFLKMNKSGGKPKLISLEAYKAVLESEEASEYKSPFYSWFRHRIAIAIASGVCLLYLISGQLFDIVSVILDTLSDMFKYF